MPAALRRRIALVLGNTVRRPADALIRRRLCHYARRCSTLQLLRLFSFETPPALPEEVAPQSAGADVSEALPEGQAATAEGGAPDDSAPAAEAVGTPGEGSRRATTAGEGAEAAAAQPAA